MGGAHWIDVYLFDRLGSVIYLYTSWGKFQKVVWLYVGKRKRVMDDDFRKNKRIRQAERTENGKIMTGKT